MGAGGINVAARGTTIIRTRAVLTVTETYQTTLTIMSDFAFSPMTHNIGPVNPAAHARGTGPD